MNCKRQHTLRAITLFVALAGGLLALLQTSCIPQRRIMLLQDKSGVGDSLSLVLNDITDRYILKPNDQLYISVNSPDEKFSKFFNATSGGGIYSNNMSVSTYYYDLDDSVSVIMPIIGRVCFKGCTLSMAYDSVRVRIAEYLNEFSVTVKLQSNSFVCLGEFRNNSRITMPKQQITVYEALALAGGFTTYAQRGNVLLMRLDENGKHVIHTLDLSGRDIINSDLYYVYPNDVLYAKPMRVKMLGFGETFSLSLITTLITFYLLVRSLVN